MKEKIKSAIPHRFPFLLIDRVINCNPGNSIVALKNVSYNEPFFEGHFPDKPIMPGVLIVEAMAQACGILISRSGDITSDTGFFYLVGVDKARFRKSVEPGDQLILEIQFLKQLKDIHRFQAKANVDSDIVCSAIITTTGKMGEN